MVSGIEWKRMFIALAVAGLCGLFCAYGVTVVDIPGLVVTMPLLLMTFYARLLIGFAVGLSGGIRLVGGELKNAALRGIILGLIMSLGVFFYGGGEIFMAFGAAYGLITDVLATRFG